MNTNIHSEFFSMGIEVSHEFWIFKNYLKIKKMSNLSLSLIIGIFFNCRWCKWDNTSHIRLLFYCFCDCFLENVLDIFWEYFWENLQKNLKFFFHIILLRFMFKIWQKNLLKKIQIHKQVLLLFKKKCYNI
jgi:hypothetical protein